jgi:hypothetical protein
LSSLRRWLEWRRRRRLLLKKQTIQRLKKPKNVTQQVEKTQPTDRDFATSRMNERSPAFFSFPVILFHSLSHQTWNGFHIFERSPSNIV